MCCEVGEVKWLDEPDIECRDWDGRITAGMRVAFKEEAKEVMGTATVWSVHGHRSGPQSEGAGDCAMMPKAWEVEAIGDDGSSEAGVKDAGEERGRGD